MSFRKKQAFSFLFLGLFLLAYLHQVPRHITSADKEAFEQYLSLLSKEEVASLVAWKEERMADFNHELQLLALLQSAVIEKNPKGQPIPQGQSRQPRDLYTFSGGGHCHDRAYTLAKLYRYFGWPSRQFALFKREKGYASWQTLSRRGSVSHAALEVKTSKGWMVIDPDYAWQALDQAGKPRQARELPLPAYYSTPPPSWHYTQEAIVVYGLYARHGRFFWPYNAVPDVNYWELLANFAH